DAECFMYIRTNSNNEPNGFFGFLHDITERKRAEKLKEKFTQQLKREVDMRTKELKEALEEKQAYLDEILRVSQYKSEFMATMSHELRTPLNAIIGFTDLLNEGIYGDLNEDQKKFVNNVQESAQQLLEMINNILDITKIESGKFQLNIEPVVLNDLIIQIKNIVQPLYSKKGLDFFIDGLENKIVIPADALRLKQIITNLVSNAIKYTEKGHVNINVVEKKDIIEINVIDTGIGIDESDYYKVFKEFERIETRSNHAVQGTGLGLPLAKRLANLHGGDLTFSSKIGAGSIFTLTLPKKQSDFLSSSKELNDTNASMESFQQFGILMLTKDRQVSQQIKQILYKNKKFNGKFYVEQNIESGYAFIRNYDINIIIFDVNICDGDKIDETIKQIIDIKKNMKIIMLLEKEDANMISHYYEIGSMDIMVKNDISEQLLLRVFKNIFNLNHNY
ncbi:MAG: hybrid sensor histidine kinase/response regulator, partial [Promethearchaeota archaeon]